MSAEGRLAGAMAGDGCRAEPITEAHREPLRAACAEDPDIWQLWMLDFGPEGFDRSFDRIAELPWHRFVLFDGDSPAGTASLAHDDLDSRPDLAPWLAGVYVPQMFRGRGHASALVRHVEGFARAAGVDTLWLYTWTAAPLYAGLGWVKVGLEHEIKRNHQVVLMRRDLAGDSA